MRIFKKNPLKSNYFKIKFFIYYKFNSTNNDNTKTILFLITQGFPIDKLPFQRYSTGTGAPTQTPICTC